MKTFCILVSAVLLLSAATTIEAKLLRSAQDATDASKQRRKKRRLMETNNKKAWDKPGHNAPNPTAAPSPSPTASPTRLPTVSPTPAPTPYPTNHKGEKEALKEQQKQWEKEMKEMEKAKEANQYINEEEVMANIWSIQEDSPTASPTYRSARRSACQKIWSVNERLGLTSMDFGTGTYIRYNDVFQDGENIISVAVSAGKLYALEEVDAAEVMDDKDNNKAQVLETSTAQMLVTIDPTNGKLENVGNIGIEGAVAMAGMKTQRGILFVVSSTDAGNILHMVNPENGNSKPLFAGLPDDIVDITFNYDFNLLYLIDRTGALYTINVKTGEIRRLGNTRGWEDSSTTVKSIMFTQKNFLLVIPEQDRAGIYAVDMNNNLAVKRISGENILMLPKSGGDLYCP